MAKIHREGLTLLSESEGATRNRHDLKYNLPPILHLHSAF
jgi:hypothetical protein